jgi:predicted ATP-grasp superfamily ATP-dependent carboligase
MNALVTDAELRNAVAGIRGLGRGGFPVVAVAAGRAAAGFRSRYVVARAGARSVLDDPAGFASDVAEAARRHAPAIVYPGREESLGVLLEARAALPEGVTLPYPPTPVVRALRKKPDLEAAANRIGMGVPRTLAIGTAAELARRPPPLPCVLKETEPGGSVPLTTVASTRDELDAFVQALPPEQPLLAQELARGPLVSLALVLDRSGRAVGAFQQVALRTWPRAAGGTSLGRSVALDPELAERSTELLALHGYWGLAQLQFIGSGRGPLLIDINPRFYGTLPLALACGINLSALWHAVATGGDAELPAAGPYRIGLSYRWLEADASAALQGHGSRLLPLRRSDAGAMWDPADPAPSAQLAAAAFGARAARVSRRVAARLSMG